MLKHLFLTIALGLSIPFAAVGQQQQRVVSPEIAGARTTFRITAPNADAVTLSGNWMGGGETLPLTKGPEGLWEVSIATPAPELYTYSFRVDGAYVTDPANPVVQRDGVRHLSMFIVDDPSTANYREANRRGNLKQQWYDSPTLGMNRRMFVYTPYGYETSTRDYPVLYLLHGGGGDEDAWNSMGRACQILDNLIEKGLATPMIVVMPNGNASQQAARPLMLPEKTIDNSDPANANLYIHSLARDIVPFIEKSYRVQATRDSRAVSGLSMGGGHTLAVTNNYPGMFGYICPMSMGLREGQNVDAELQKVRDAGYKLYWLGCGSADGAFPRAQELDRALTRNGVEHTFHVSAGGHTWPVWRDYLEIIAPLLFK
jgi:enterochelin esterase family protein